MSKISQKIDRLTPLQKAVYALKETRAKLDVITYEQTEPIAIIGMGCRFPGGANSPESFWQMLYEGIDGIGEIPSQRWNKDAYYDPNPEISGKMHVRQGGFLDVAVDEFDAEFFGLAPREVVSMDPQQRLLQEVSWEALENAAQAPDKLVGSQTGVFIGMTTNDYAQRAMFDEPKNIDIYTATGNALNAAAGRLSYTFGLQGPSMVIDTACSSSLVSVHLACQSLRDQECNLALAGGVSLMLSPEVSIAMSKLNALATDGRCKTFDAAADGYGRGEGCGMIVLKRLSDAITDNNQVLAVIKGSAVNQDGRSSGLTVPKGLAQRQVIRAALTRAKVKPAEVSYVEAHGTGTPLGDPIELKALTTVLGEERSNEHPIIVGSVKTNIGHLESAAGIAGLIKVVLAMQHKTIPSHLHLHELNPQIAAHKGSLIIPTESISWQQKSVYSRIAGVSSFGFTGTNAHVILEEAPAKELVATFEDRPLQLLALSAKTQTALEKLISRWDSNLEKHSLSSLSDICFSANAGRAHFNNRLAIVASSLEEVKQQLAVLNAGLDVVPPVNRKPKPKIAFLFAGQSFQYQDMGRQLYETQPTFRKVLNSCKEVLDSYLDISLLEVLYPESKETSLLNETVYTQPALFSLEYALAQLWKSWGIEPSIVIGHGVGEYVAACISGVFSLEDGLKLVTERGKLMQALPPNGAMAAIFADETKVKKIVELYKEKVSIAAVNSVKNTVISGERNAIESILQQLNAEKVKFRRLEVSHAFHSSLMEPMLEEFNCVAAKVDYSAPQLELVSNLTGHLIKGNEVASASYWCQHARETVKFASGVRELYKLNCEVFIEIGPEPISIGISQQCLPEKKGIWLPSLRSAQENWQTLLQSLKLLYEKGIDINWHGFDRDYSRQCVSLPNYPFERQRYWFDYSKHQPSKTIPTSLNPIHPLLDRRLASPLQQIQFDTKFHLDSLPLVADHQVYGKPLVNFVIYLEMAFAGTVDVFRKNVSIIEDVSVSQALTLSNYENKPVQLIIEPEKLNKASFQIFSLSDCEDNRQAIWSLHAAGKVCFTNINEKTSIKEPISLAEVKKQFQQETEISSSEFYQIMENKGAALGYACRWLERVWRKPGKALGQIRLLESDNSIYKDYQLPLGVVDGCFQLLAASLPDSAENYILSEVEKFQFFDNFEGQLWGYASVQFDEDNKTITGNARVFNEVGQIAIEVTNAQLKRLSPKAIQLIPEKVKSITTLKRRGSLSSEELLAIESESRHQRVEQYLLQELAKALQLHPSKLNSQQSLISLVDSMITVELKNRIEADLKVVVPTAMFFEETTISELASFILKQLVFEVSKLKLNLEYADEEILGQTLEELEELSESEVKKMLSD